MMKIANTRAALPAFFLLLLATLAVSPRAAYAHARLVSSTPQVNATVAGPDVSIALRFNSRIDAERSTLSLLKPDGKVETLAVSSGSPAALAARATGLGKGAYILRWQVLASDGHISRGEVPFHVK